MLVEYKLLYIIQSLCLRVSLCHCTHYHLVVENHSTFRVSISVFSLIMHIYQYLKPNNTVQGEGPGGGLYVCACEVVERVCACVGVMCMWWGLW